jgi:hypothetical protein
VIVIHPQGDSVQPGLRCAVCQLSLPISAAWVAFRPLGHGLTESPGTFVHKACADGHAERLFQTNQLVLWQATDVLSRLLRP